MKLYHYTSTDHLRLILSDGKLKLTASNLEPPKNLHLIMQEDGIPSFVADNDNYKPVVWFTSELNFDNAIKNGLSKRKTEVAICINDAKPPRFRKWLKWAQENHIEKKQFDSLTKSATNYKTWYISEAEVPIDENVEIIFRPDIFEQINNGEHGITIKEN